MMRRQGSWWGIGCRGTSIKPKAERRLAELEAELKRLREEARVMPQKPVKLLRNEKQRIDPNPRLRGVGMRNRLR
jgi:hypothetical protein